MKTIGRRASSSEYTIFDESLFIHQGTSYERDHWNGRCYRFDEPSGFYTKAAREGGLVKKRISAALFTRLYYECEAQISEAGKGGAV